MTKFRKGDRVSLLATVKDDYDDKTGVLIRADGYYGDMLVMPVHLTRVSDQSLNDENDRLIEDHMHGGMVAKIEGVLSK